MSTRLHQASHKNSSQLHLTYIRSFSLLYSSLSLNITREITDYIGPDPVLVSLHSDHLCIYNLVTQTYTISAFPSLRSSLSGTSFCMLSPRRMLVVGGPDSQKDAFSVDIYTCAVTRESNMLKGRAWPGVTVYADFIWVFGGNTKATLTSAERFHTKERTWTRIRDMKTPKVCFTPCEHHGLIYLPEISTQRKPLEVYFPKQDRYEPLALMLFGAFYGSVSFICDSELYIVDIDSRAGKWSLNNANEFLTPIEVKGSEVQCVTSGPVIRVGETVFWLDWESELVRMDLGSARIEKVDRDK